MLGKHVDFQINFIKPGRGMTFPHVDLHLSRLTGQTGLAVTGSSPEPEVDGGGGGGTAGVIRRYSNLQNIYFSLAPGGGGGGGGGGVQPPPPPDTTQPGLVGKR